VLASLVVDHIAQAALIDRLATHFANVEVLRDIGRLAAPYRFDGIQFFTSDH
jgi:hypothetical protein